MFSVNFWGSDPAAGNDDCYSGNEYASFEEAMVAYNEPVKDRDVAFVEIEGPNTYAKRHNPSFRPSEEDDDGWRLEMAREAGMAFGCDAYNEAMGWD